MSPEIRIAFYTLIVGTVICGLVVLAMEDADFMTRGWAIGWG